MASQRRSIFFVIIFRMFRGWNRFLEVRPMCSPSFRKTGRGSANVSTNFYNFPCSLMRSHAVSCSLMQSHAVSCSLMQRHAVSCGLIWSHGVSCSLMGSHAVSCGLLQSHAVRYFWGWNDISIWFWQILQIIGTWGGQPRAIRGLVSAISTSLTRTWTGIVKKQRHSS